MTTVYYYGESEDTHQDYEYMIKDPSFLSLDISEPLKAYNFFTNSFKNCEVELEFLIPILVGMMNVKGEFFKNLEDFISSVIIKYTNEEVPSYFNELRSLTSNCVVDYVEQTYQQEISCDFDVFFEAENMHRALKNLGAYILDHISESAYRGNYLAYELFYFENDTIILAPREIPKLQRPIITKSLELIYRKSLPTIS